MRRDDQHRQGVTSFANPVIKPTEWMAAAKADWKQLPADVQDEFGDALQVVQWGQMPHLAKPLKRELKGVWELRDNHEGNTYRAYYTVVFKKAVYVLHCHMKRSKEGGEIPRGDKEVIQKRFKAAQLHYGAKYGEGT